MPKTKTEKAKALTRKELVDFVDSNDKGSILVGGYPGEVGLPIKAADYNSYNLSIQLGDETLRGSGNTALAALQSITKPVKIVTKGQVTMTKGDKKMTKIMQPWQLKKLFYPLAQGVLSKQLDYLLK